MRKWLKGSGGAEESPFDKVILPVDFLKAEWGIPKKPIEDEPPLKPDPKHSNVYSVPDKKAQTTRTIPPRRHGRAMGNED